MRFLRWWLAEHTDIGHTTPTAVMLFADQGDPDHPEPWPPADAEQRTYRLPCHQTGCSLEHDVRPASVVDVLAAIGATLSPPAKPSPGECPTCTSDVPAERWYVPGATGGPTSCRDEWHADVDDEPRIRVGEIKQLTVWTFVSVEAAGLPADWTCACGETPSQVGSMYPVGGLLCAHCRRPVPQAAGSSRGGRMSGTVS